MLCQLAPLTWRTPMPSALDCRPYYLLLIFCLQVTAWPHDSRVVKEDECPSSGWSSMCRPCCEYYLIQCRCPSQGAQVGYTVPCCRNALDQCDPCIIHPGCSLFENCKSCNNGTWEVNDDFFIRGRFCTECRQGWSGGDCKTCGGVIQWAQGHVVLESYPTNARCEWTVQVKRGQSIELRFSMLSLEPDHSCRYDYVELRDGDSLSSPVIGRFCGDDLPPPVKSSGNTLHILFASDGSDSNFDGFALTFQESSDCSPSPCLHHGTCFLDPLNSFRCVCTAGYAGQRCENNAARSQACEPPEKPVNGDLLPVFGMGKELISVGYLCHPPYTLIGTQQRTCLPNATWSGTVPTCVQAARSQACEPPEKPVNGDLLPVFGVGEELISVGYLCHPPYTLIGTQQRTCLPNATWSGTVPTCVQETPTNTQTYEATGSSTGRVRFGRCAPPPKVHNGYYKRAPDTVGGPDTIEFSCKNSYILSGNRVSTCLSNGSWSSRSPQCVRACREPKVSELVTQRVVKPQPISSPAHRLHLSSRYKVMDLLAPSFDLHTTDKRPTGEDSVLGELPRGFHHLYTSIEYKCASPLYRHNGSSQRTCLKTGKWSGRHVSCSPACGKVTAFSYQNLTATHWPWHVAIYVRSPVGHSVDAQQGHVVTILEHQGASEESTFWYLACSGALVTQRSVLVAAHCVVEQDKRQPHHPARAIVVVGTQHHTSQNQTRSLQQRLRVSNILVHPNFDPVTLDSDLALLKLLDKAKISEHVLPVCLPKVQGGEVTAREAYATEWMGDDARPLVSLYTHSTQTTPVELRDVIQCEREFAHATVITDNMLCVMNKHSRPDSPCRAAIPGITVIPSVASSNTPITSTLLSSHTEEQEDSNIVWDLLGLESFNYERKNCHRQFYSAQTRIVNFRDWIEKNMK